MSTGRSYDMNEHVLFDILLCLPVKSLLRFKAVCKDWFSLIESSAFNSEYLNYHRNSKEDSLIIWGGYNYEPKPALLSGSKYEECDYDVENWQFWHPARPSAVRLIGHCDGIVCLAYEDEIALWNPALKQLKPLPPSLFTSPEYVFGIGFGIDIKGNDYKVVRIGFKWNGMEVIDNPVEVYNLAGDNSWRITHKDDVLPFSGFFTFAAISSSKSGMCFWVAASYDFGSEVLLSFDFNEDLFRVMPLPHIHEDLLSCSALDLLDDNVVCMREIHNHNCHNKNVEIWIEIWMLHEFGVEDSWNKIYKIGPMTLLDLIRPRGISKNGEFLMCFKPDNPVLEGDVGEIMFCLYNLHTQQRIFHDNCKLEFSSEQLIHYNASLLSLKSANSLARPT